MEGRLLGGGQELFSESSAVSFLILFAINKTFLEGCDKLSNSSANWTRVSMFSNPKPPFSRLRKVTYFFFKQSPTGKDIMKHFLPTPSADHQGPCWLDWQGQLISEIRCFRRSLQGSTFQSEENELRKGKDFIPSLARTSVGPFFRCSSFLCIPQHNAF